MRQHGCRRHSVRHVILGHAALRYGLDGAVTCHRRRAALVEPGELRSQPRALRIGEAQLAQCGLPPLNIHAHQEQIIDWVLKAQVVLARESGLTNVSEESFGVPRDDGRSGMNHSQHSAV